MEQKAATERKTKAGGMGMNVTIRIRHLITDAVLFECEAPDDLHSGLHMRHALEKAVEAHADLSGANLSGANLSGAYLSGANLKNKEKLVGKRPIFQIGPIGSRCAYFVAYITDKGLRFDAGCQRQITREVFESRLTELHGENEHAKEYRAVLALIDAHAEIWTPKEDAHVIGANPSGMDEGKK